MSSENKPGVVRRMADIPEYAGMLVGGGLVMLSPFYPPLLMTGLEVFTLSFTSLKVSETISPKGK